LETGAVVPVGAEVVLVDAELAVGEAELVDFVLPHAVSDAAVPRAISAAATRVPLRCDGRAPPR